MKTENWLHTTGWIKWSDRSSPYTSNRATERRNLQRHHRRPAWYLPFQDNLLDLKILSIRAPIYALHNREAMRMIYLSSSKPAIACSAWNHNNSSGNWPHKPLIGALAGALSFSLLISSPSSMAVDSAVLQLQKDSPLTEYCQEEDEVGAEVEMSPAVVTNEGIVEEAWEIVNDSFLDTSSRWSPDKWLVSCNQSLPLSLAILFIVLDAYLWLFSSLMAISIQVFIHSFNCGLVFCRLSIQFTFVSMYMLSIIWTFEVFLNVFFLVSNWCLLVICVKGILLWYALEFPDLT